MLRVCHYLNQFFAGVGGEEYANHPPQRRDGPVGPGRGLENLLKRECGVVVSSFVCGDNFYNEHVEAAETAVHAWLEEARPDLVAAFAVDTAIQHAPIRVKEPQPVRVLTLRASGAVGRGFERRFEAGGPRRRGITETNNCYHGHRRARRVRRDQPHKNSRR